MANEQNYELRKNIAYANHDGVELLGDLYLPKGTGPFPIVVNVHGGYWRRGSRDTFKHWGPYLAERGYAGFTISYRLSKPGKKTYPENINDVRAAVQFVRGRAAELGVDPEKIVLFGNSAGAHLAAMVALAGDSALFSGAYPDDPFAKVSTKVKVLVGAYGIYDLIAQWKHSLVGNPGDNLVEAYLGESPIRNRQIYFDASPISHAIEANKMAVFLTWGTEDDVVDYRTQSLEFLAALKQAGFGARPCVMAGAPHYWVGDPLDEPGSHSEFLAARLMRFLADNL